VDPVTLEFKSAFDSFCDVRGQHKILPSRVIRAALTQVMNVMVKKALVNDGIAHVVASSAAGELQFDDGAVGLDEWTSLCFYVRGVLQQAQLLPVGASADADGAVVAGGGLESMDGLAHGFTDEHDQLRQQGQGPGSRIGGGAAAHSKTVGDFSNVNLEAGSSMDGMQRAEEGVSRSSSLAAGSSTFSGPMRDLEHPSHALPGRDQSSPTDGEPRGYWGSADGRGASRELPLSQPPLNMRPLDWSVEKSLIDEWQNQDNPDAPQKVALSSLNAVGSAMRAAKNKAKQAKVAVSKRK
jgi:hypothetical protein